MESDIRSMADTLAKQRETLTGSALFRYTLLVYDYLYENSEMNDKGERLFTGSMAKVINEIASSKRYYSSIRNLLESPPESPCIQVYQRGTGTQPSIIRLMRPPPAVWAEIPPAKHLTAATGGATMGSDSEQDARLADIEKRLSLLREVNLKEVLSDHERRLRKLEDSGLKSRSRR